MGVIFACIALSTHTAAAATVPDPGNLLSDPILLDAGSMNISQIQSFLTSKGGYLSTYQSLFDCSAYLPDGTYFLGNTSHDAYIAINAPCGQTVSAATIIYYVAQVYGVNPKVIMATLQKESSLITAGSQNAYLINTAMGYNCPDSSGCSTTSGSNFIYQIDGGAWVLRYRYERLRGNTAYWPSVNSTACTSTTKYYSPSLYPRQQVKFYDDNGINYATINLSNAATGSLYCYTPHVFNNFPGCTNGTYASVLPTTGSSGMCYTGSYNFYAAYSAWFGSSIILPEVLDRYNSLADSATPLGTPIDQGFCADVSHTACWEGFQNGYIIYSKAAGAWESMGSIRTKWAQLGYQNGTMGFPNGPIVCGMINGGCYQGYDKGVIVGSPSTGYWNSMEPIRTKWQALGFETGALGFPISDQLCTLKNSGCYQAYQNGYIVGTSATGYWESAGGIRSRWNQLSFESGVLGYPTSDPNCTLTNSGCYQMYQGGVIVGNATTGYWESLGSIRTRWGQLGFESGQMGYPTGGQVCTLTNSGCYQMYQGGVIVGNATTGYWESLGSIRTRWGQLGFESGVLGYPTGPVNCVSGTCSQTYEHGTIFADQSGTWYTPSS
jgi:uncharacterized protein with LGFP repeats